MLKCSNSSGMCRSSDAFCSPVLITVMKQAILSSKCLQDCFARHQYMQGGQCAGTKVKALEANTKRQLVVKAKRVFLPFGQQDEKSLGFGEG